VTIDGAEYTFGAVFACIFNDDFIVMQGPGTGPGGGPFWVDFDSSSSSSDDDDVDGDGEPDSSVFINVRGGVTENELVTPLDQPDFYADNSGNFVGVEATFEITDNSVSGFGFMTDTNAITDAGELLPFEFEASCGDSDGTSNDDEQALDDMQDEVSSDDAAATVTDASGGGIVTVDGVAYAFGAEVCFFQESGFVIVGPGPTPTATRRMSTSRAVARPTSTVTASQMTKSWSVSRWVPSRWVREPKTSRTSSSVRGETSRRSRSRSNAPTTR